jgi:ribosomal protein S18 acetylase RimI-like enzyme
MRSPAEARERALAWQHAAHAAVCDVVVPWTHGSVVRATRYPQFYDYNVVRVEEDPAMSVEQLVALADEALAGLEHRRLDFDDAAMAEPLRAQLSERGWRSMRLLWMLHSGAASDDRSDVRVEELSYAAVHELRVAWHREDYPDVDASGYFSQAREVALSRGVRVLAVSQGSLPVAFAQLESIADTTEVTQVYVRPEHRGGGIGTALTRAAIAGGAQGGDLWICADDEDRAKHLYARLGFRAVCVTLQFLRLAANTSDTGG